MFWSPVLVIVEIPGAVMNLEDAKKQMSMKFLFLNQRIE